MNASLISLYEKLAAESTQDFLQNNIEPDANWGKHIKGITLQIDLSEDVQDRIEQYEKELNRLEPDSLLFLPGQYHHISFRQVVFWNDSYKDGHDITWQHLAKEFLEKFLRLDKRFTTFPISFDRIIPMTSAIIYCAYDDADQMNKLRNNFHSLLPFPTETTKKNTFIHTTIARFKHKLNNPARVFDYLQQQTAPIQMYPKEIILRREHIFPSIGTTELARIRLV